MFSIVLFACLTVFPGTVAARDTIVATFRDGSISRSDLDSWRRWAHGRVDTVVPLRKQVNAIVLLEVWDAIAAREGYFARRENVVQKQQFVRELAARSLTARLREEARPAGSEVEAYYEAHRAEFEEPRRWRLENISLQVPPQADRQETERIRERIEALHAELKAGADFGELAVAASESSTRRRRGLAGWVTEERLDPRLAARLKKMQVGEISEVLAVERGFTILRLVDIRKGGLQPLDEVRRRRIESRLQLERQNSALDSLQQRILSEASPLEITGSFELSAAGDSPAFTYQGPSSRLSVPMDEYRHFLRSRDVRDPLHEIPRERHRELIEAMVIEIGLEAEAERIGLTETPEYRNELQWNLKRLSAHLVLPDRLRREVRPPTEAEIAAYYEEHQEDFWTPETFHMVALEVPLNSETPRSLVDRVAAVPPRLEQGEQGLQAIAHEIDPDGRFVQLRDLGWMKEEDFFHLGFNLEEEARELPLMGTSGAVQQGPKLVILGKVGRRPSTRTPLEQARQKIFLTLGNSRRVEARNALEARILEEQRVELVESGAVD